MVCPACLGVAEVVPCLHNSGMRFRVFFWWGRQVVQLLAEFLGGGTSQVAPPLQTRVHLGFFPAEIRNKGADILQVQPTGVHLLWIRWSTGTMVCPACLGVAEVVPCLHNSGMRFRVFFWWGRQVVQLPAEFLGGGAIQVDRFELVVPELEGQLGLLGQLGLPRMSGCRVVGMLGHQLPGSVEVSLRLIGILFRSRGLDNPPLALSLGRFDFKCFQPDLSG